MIFAPRLLRINAEGMARATHADPRAGGAMALLCGHIDANIIRLVGRWQSDAMFRYLHAQALPLISALSTTMLTHSNFNLAPGADLPTQARILINRHPTLLQAPLRIH